MWPSIDHSWLSPSGKVSKRYKKRINEKARRILFGENGLETPSCPQPTRKEYLERKIKEFTELKERGITPRKLQREIDKMGLEIISIEKASGEATTEGKAEGK